jgi:hypothetical protein
MTLTQDQIQYLRDDLGDNNTPYAFEDEDLNRNYARSGNDYDKTYLLCVRQLVFNAAKFYNYVSGFTRQEQDSIYKNLKDMYDLLKNEVRGTQQVRTVGISIIPPVQRDDPSDA